MVGQAMVMKVCVLVAVLLLCNKQGKKQKLNYSAVSGNQKNISKTKTLYIQSSQYNTIDYNRIQYDHF
jgi:hypothetical protein